MLMTPQQRDQIIALARAVHGDDAADYLKGVREENPYPTVGDASQLIARLQREARNKTANTLPEGRYALAIRGVVTFFQVDRPATGKWAGRVFVSRIDGDTKTPIRGRDGHHIREQIEADPLAAATLYGRESQVCGICQRALTNEESRQRGIGPICAAKF